MLNYYLATVQGILNDPNNQFYTVANLTSWINDARYQVAGQSNCVQDNGVATLLAGTSQVQLNAITALGGTGYSVALNVQSVSLYLNGENLLLEGRPWPWFNAYYNNGAATLATGQPTVWSQLTQGATGTLVFNPVADTNYSVVVQAGFLPAQLLTDLTPEVIPYPWTDAVPYFAAYLSYMNAQKGEDAGRMLQQYQQYMSFARTGVTPDVLPGNFPDRVMQISSPRAGGDG